MIYISHRGNIDGKTDRENHPSYIDEALFLGYDVEIDVWNIDNKLYLGHDEPQYKIDIEYLKNNKLWCHAKNLDAFQTMYKSRTIHCFWHQTDDIILTSRGYVWTYPGKPLYENSIVVMPETYTVDKKFNCLGICSDYIKKYT